MIRQFDIIVRGRVQGVFYRASTREKAIELGLKGTVRNQPDGSVRIIAQGDTSKLDELVSWCWKGPIMASVKAVEVNEIELAEKKYPDFTILR